MKVLSERQKREVEFYEEFSQRNAPAKVSFDSISGEQTRPGNSYWHVMSVVKQNFRSGDQKLLDLDVVGEKAPLSFPESGMKCSALTSHRIISRLRSGWPISME